jgi:predicted ATPase
LKGDKIEIKIEGDIGSIDIKWGDSEFPLLVTKGDFEKLFENNFTRLFIGKENLTKHPFPNDENTLNFFAGNLVKVLSRLLKNSLIKQELIEWCQLLIPEFKNVDVGFDKLHKEDTIRLYEEYSNKPFTKDLISDGTYNILCLLTSVYQNDNPQMLLIEEPENGLNPKVIKELVDFFREISIDKGHHIWLNTHSQSLVSKVKTSEGILVDKEEGKTKVKQFKDKELFDLTMDEAWLSNVLGGGTPW